MINLPKFQTHLIPFVISQLLLSKSQPKNVQTLYEYKQLLNMEIFSIAVKQIKQLKHSRLTKSIKKKSLHVTDIQ